MKNRHPTIATIPAIFLLSGCNDPSPTLDSAIFYGIPEVADMIRKLGGKTAEELEAGQQQ